MHLPYRMTADSTCRPRPPPREPKELKTSVAHGASQCVHSLFTVPPSHRPPFSETTRKFIMGPHVRFGTFHGKWKSVNAVGLELDISAWLPVLSIRIISRIFFVKSWKDRNVSILNFSQYLRVDDSPWHIPFFYQELRRHLLYMTWHTCWISEFLINSFQFVPHGKSNLNESSDERFPNFDVK